MYSHGLTSNHFLNDFGGKKCNVYGRTNNSVNIICSKTFHLFFQMHFFGLIFNDRKKWAFVFLASFCPFSRCTRRFNGFVHTNQFFFHYEKLREKLAVHRKNCMSMYLGSCVKWVKNERFPKYFDQMFSFLNSDICHSMRNCYWCDFNYVKNEHSDYAYYDKYQNWEKWTFAQSIWETVHFSLIWNNRPNTLTHSFSCADRRAFHFSVYLWILILLVLESYKMWTFLQNSTKNRSDQCQLISVQQSGRNFVQFRSISFHSCSRVCNRETQVTKRLRLVCEAAEEKRRLDLSHTHTRMELYCCTDFQHFSINWTPHAGNLTTAFSFVIVLFGWRPASL